MSSVNDGFLKSEEKKIKQNLAKLANVSTSAVCRKIYKKPSSVTVLEAQCEEPCSTRTSATTSGTQCHAHLSHFFSFLQKPVRRTTNTERKQSKGYTPFSKVDSTVTINRPKPPVLQRFLSSQLQKNSATGTDSSIELNQKSSSISGTMERFPSQYRFSRNSVSHEPINGNSATMKSLNEMYFKASQERTCERSRSFSYIEPEEALRCRYLRLSESNIVDLLQRCKDAGIHVDIHPHMKESDIDINTVMSSGSINTMSL